MFPILWPPTLRSTFTDYYPRVNSCVALRYTPPNANEHRLSKPHHTHAPPCCTFRRVALPSPVMTVPGKGGRPRKWRSDADRVRAYRARQAGLDEPPVLAQALDDGDELARVWAMVRQLGEQLDTANATLKQVRRERDQTRRELEREQHRWGWIESHNTELTAERDRLLSELDELRDRPRLIETPRPATTTATPPPAPQPLMSRAERRRIEREQQRRRGR